MLRQAGKITVAIGVVAVLAVGAWGVASLAGGGEGLMVAVFAVSLCALEVLLRPRRR